MYCTVDCRKHLFDVERFGEVLRSAALHHSNRLSNRVGATDDDHGGAARAATGFLQHVHALVAIKIVV